MSSLTMAASKMHFWRLSMMKWCVLLYILRMASDHILGSSWGHTWSIWIKFSENVGIIPIKICNFLQSLFKWTPNLDYVIHGCSLMKIGSQLVKRQPTVQSKDNYFIQTIIQIIGNYIFQLDLISITKFWYFKDFNLHSKYQLWDHNSSPNPNRIPR